MKEIRVYKPIDKEDIFFSFFGEEDPFSFSADAIHKVFDENPEETEFTFNINCDGGSVAEGLRIYDVMRMSGKTLFCNVENNCHSMAIVLLLAAPKENRTGNPNMRGTIHEVRGGSWDALKADELRTLADEIEREQNSILAIYADRTGYDRAELEILMKEEKNRTAQEFLQYGFISKINTYSTNFKPKNQMSKPTKTVKELLNEAKELGKRILNLTEGGEPVNFEFKDADGVVLFTTEKEDDSIAVGDAASPDGTYELPDERTVVVTGGVVESISEPEADATEVENLQTENASLKEELANALGMITELSNHVQSNFVATPRTKTPGKQNVKTQSSEELKNEAREKRAIMNGGKK
ncbi:MAG: ATP-dependent Clp protease proteolytic subunit [Bacteroidota bacterium]